MRRGAAAAGMLVLGSAGALAEPAPQTAPTLRFYGSVNPAFLSFDDGQDRKGLLVDNDNDIGRIGIWWEWAFAPQTSLKFNFETAIGTRPSDTVSMTETPEGFAWNQTDLRKAELIFAATWGQFSAGQGSMATDTVAEIDYSGTLLPGYSDYQAVAGGFAFRQSDGTLSGITLADVFPNLEGSRRWRVRYDTPTVSGFSGAIAYGRDILSSTNTDHYYDAALRYAGDAGAFKLGGGIGYAVTRTEAGSTTEDLMGSMSVLHDPTGLNLTLAAGSQLQGGNYVYGKAGWIGDLIAAGQTALAVEYYRSNDLGINAGSGQSWGVVVNQVLPHAVSAYFGYRRYQLTSPGTEFLLANSYLLGVEWTF